MAAGNASMEGVFKNGGSKWEANPTPQLSGTKVIQIKIQLSAGGIQCSLNFFSQRNEVRQLQWAGIYSQDEGLGTLTQDSGLGTRDLGLQPYGFRRETNAVAGFACNLQFAPLFKL